MYGAHRVLEIILSKTALRWHDTFIPNLLHITIVIGFYISGRPKAIGLGGYNWINKILC